jgi:hypothetical protein
LLQIANTIASTGGNIEYQAGSLIDWSSCEEACAMIVVVMQRAVEE